MTLNAVILRYFTEYNTLGGQLHTVCNKTVADRIYFPAMCDGDILRDDQETVR